ncbi:MAG: hydrogenase maturation protease [Phycisphaerae bacterium]|nr:hydrogenase maturation protease [Phycisphaerae bacterium]
MRNNRITIVGCGRTDSGDDAVGIRVGEALVRCALPDTRILLTEWPGVDLIADMEGVELFVLIDAARAVPGHPPGSWEKIDYRNFSGTLLTSHHESSHGWSIAETLELADRLGELPPRVWIYAIFGARFEFGAQPSEATIAVVPEVTAAIQHDVTQFLGIENGKLKMENVG